MGNDDILTDDYVAELLAQDAAERSTKYSTMGLEAYRSSKPGSKAKPNTRFLQNIIKSTQNHNDALLAKEAAESKARLHSLAEAQEKKQRRYKPDATNIRQRQLGTISAILSGKKRRGGKDGKDEISDLPDTGDDKVEKDETTRSQLYDSRERTSRRESTKRWGEEDEKEKSSSRRHRRRSRSPERERRHRHRHRSRSAEGSSRRSRSPRLRRETQRPAQESSERKRGQDRERRKSRTRKEEESGNEKAEDVDPLDEYLVPQPPVRPRGRGAASGPSAMDSRFASDYDPKVDVAMESDGADEWGDALEAYRDRQKWKQQGADRLRTAGFTDEQITKWETGEEASVKDVRWSKKGEKREWDRGKATTLNGSTSAETQWPA